VAGAAGALGSGVVSGAGGGGALGSTRSIFVPVRRSMVARSGFESGERASDRFDAADAGRGGALGKNFERADVAGVGDVRATAQFRAVERAEDAHPVAVFLAEEHHRAGILGFGERHLALRDRTRREDALVDEILDRADLRGGKLGSMREIETQLIGRDERARLVDVLAEDFPQRFAAYAAACAEAVRETSDDDAPVFTPLEEISFLSWGVARKAARRSSTTTASRPPVGGFFCAKQVN